MAPHVPCARGRVAPARHGSDRPQLAVAAWELNLSLTSSGALRDGPRAAPSEAPIPVVLAQRMRRLAYKLGPAAEATSGGRTRHRLMGALAPGAAVPLSGYTGLGDMSFLSVLVGYRPPKRTRVAPAPR